MVVLYSFDVRWKLCDFGISAEATSRMARTSRYSHGTSCYRAPELLRQPAKYTNRSDLWALGCIIYELSADRTAFDGDWAVHKYDQSKDTIMYNPYQWVNEGWRETARTIILELLRRD